MNCVGILCFNKTGRYAYRRVTQKHTYILQMDPGNSTIRLEHTACAPRLNRSPSDEILIANNGTQVYIYDPTGSTLKHTVPTKHNKTSQVSATRSGLIVTSSCCYSNPGVVTVYDRNGNAGKFLQAPSWCPTCLLPWMSRTGCM